MKALPALITLSVVLNLVLIYAALRSPGVTWNKKIAAAAQRLDGERPHGSAGEMTSPVASASSAAAALDGKPAAKEESGARAKGVWSGLDLDDLDQVRERLKAAGFSGREIRGVMSVLISRKIDAARFSAKVEPQPYWRNDGPDFADPKLRSDRQRQFLEEQALYRKYVSGPEHMADDVEAQDLARARFGPLPVEKLQALTAIEADYQELRIKQSADSPLQPGADPRARREAEELLEKEKLADVAAVLTPEEFAAYELRSNPTANTLRHRLAAFQPTEAEFKELFAIHKAYDERQADPSLSPEQRKALTEQMTAEAARRLGPERAEDYREVTQHGSNDTARLIARLGLPARVGGQVRSMQDDVVDRARDIAERADLSTQAKKAQLQALANEATEKLTLLLGPDGYRVYYDLKSDWIEALKNPPAQLTP